MLIIIKKIFTQLNVFFQYKKQGLSLWKCPQFLFAIMGTFIMISAVVTYILATRYLIEPKIAFFIVTISTIVLFIITFSIIRGLEALIEANQMKSEFIRIASHQLRNPITNLKWTLSFLAPKDSKEDKEKQIYFQSLKENIFRMEGLVSDLLTVSKIEQEGLFLNKIEFSFEDLVKKVIFEINPIAKNFNIKIKLEVENSLPKIFEDFQRIKLVVKNLIENAIYYSEKEKSKIKGIVYVRLKKRSKNLFFEIEDYGRGISDEDQKHIFQKFFKSKNILKYQSRGLGLSLYVCKFIIKKSRGKIGFKSKEGRGSTFWFTLPIFIK